MIVTFLPILGDTPVTINRDVPHSCRDTSANKFSGFTSLGLSERVIRCANQTRVLVTRSLRGQNPTRFLALSSRFYHGSLFWQEVDSGRVWVRFEAP